MIAAAFWLASPMVHAAGLGQLSVISPLGQPLNAEIEIVSLQPGEEEGLVARLASPDAFRAAGIDFNPALVSARFAIERRGPRPLPSVPARAAEPAPAPGAEAQVEKAAAAEAEKPAAAEAEKAAAEPVGEPAAAEEGKVAVKKGDTLSEIARQNLPRGANLNQMLIAIYRANEDAFIRKNVNLLRAGRILDIPGAEAVSAIDPEEAKRLVQAHMDDFAVYRSRLAAASTSVEAPGGRREAEGKIEPKPQAPAAAPQDQVRLSKADPSKPAAPASRAAREDDAVARERALKETQSRVTDLERNVTDLQKLLEMKILQLAGYGVWTWRKKKTTQARFQDSVLGAASTTGSPTGTGAALAAPSVSQGSLSQPLAGMEAYEVDPIAEADVYMAYGRDAQAEEILKESLQKDAKRTAVHSKLPEIYANRRDARAFEQTALKLKSLTNGSDRKSTR